MLGKFGVLNLGALAGMTLYAFRQKDGLYFPSMLYLMDSPVSKLLLTTTLLWVLLACASIFQRLLIGPRLRAIEVTHLREYGWLTVSEFLLSMTTFRDDFTVSFLVRFGALMLVKAGHWLCRDRMEYMEETEDLPPRYHERMIALFLILYIIDLGGLIYCCRCLYDSGPSSLLLFATEFGLMLLTLFMTFGRYLLNVHDAHINDTWEHRGTALFYIELVGDLSKLSVCLIFFFLTIRFYGFPLHMFRDMLMTGVALTKRLGDMIRYRKAMAELDRRYPTVTEEELNGLADRTCIICREELTTTAKKLNCGHYFHVKCLRSWMERQQVCPTCRGDILRPPTPIPTPTVVVNQQPILPQPRHRVRLLGTEELLDRQIDNFHELVRESHSASRERIKKLQELSDSLRRTTELIADLQEIDVQNKEVKTTEEDKDEKEVLSKVVKDTDIDETASLSKKSEETLKRDEVESAIEKEESEGDYETEEEDDNN